MKRNLRLLNYLSKKFDLTKFYSISIRDSSIVLQGKFDAEINIMLSKKGTPTIDDNGYINYYINTLNIVFT